jgi:ribosomal-protein-alanine N-acetyltransferase
VTSSPAIDSGGVNVRRADEPDLLAVRRIEEWSFPDPWPYEAFQRFVGDPGFLVADDDGDVIAFVVADVVPNRGRPLGHVKDLAVHPRRRDEGVGTTLLSRALMVLAQSGVVSVKLEVRESNDAARSLYEQFGFEPVHRVSEYYDDEEDAVVLVSELRQ